MLPENCDAYERAKSHCPEHYILDFVGQVPDRNKNYIAIYAPRNDLPAIKDYRKKYYCAIIDGTAADMASVDSYACTLYKAYIWNAAGAEIHKPVLNVKICRGSGVRYTLSENYQICRGQIKQTATFGPNPPSASYEIDVFDPSCEVYPIYIPGLQLTKPKPACLKESAKVIDLTSL